MSAYDNVVVGKLKLKGKALDVKAGGMKKKKKQKKQYEQISQAVEGKALCSFYFYFNPLKKIIFTCLEIHVDRLG